MQRGAAVGPSYGSGGVENTTVKTSSPALRARVDPRAGVRTLLQPRRHRPVRRSRMGHPVRRHRQREGPGRLRAARRRDAPLLVAAGHQHRRLEVLPRADWLARAGAQRQAAHRPGRRHDHRMGAQPAVFRERGRPVGVLGRPEAPARVSEGGVQLAGLVQRRVREAPAVLGLLHQLRAGHDGVDPDAGAHRGDALQVRVRAPDRTCRRSGRRASCSRAAGRRRVRCRS